MTVLRRSLRVLALLLVALSAALVPIDQPPRKQRGERTATTTGGGRRPAFIVPAATPEDSGDDDGAEKEYRAKLAEAEKAIQVAEEARRKLAAQRPPPMIPGTTVSRTDAGTLVLELAAPGFDSKALFSGAFSLAWFSAIIPATLSGAGLFMVPFWLAGGLVAKDAIVDPFVATKLEIGQFAWTITTKYAGRTFKVKEGATEDLRGARPEVGVIVNGVPQWEMKLYGSKEATAIPIPNASEAELQYLADEINSHLQAARLLPDPLLKRSEELP